MASAHDPHKRAKAVQAVRDGTAPSVSQAARDAGVARTTMRRWLKEAGFTTPKHKTKYDAQTRADAVERAKRGESYGKIERATGISTRQIARWVKAQTRVEQKNPRRHHRSRSRLEIVILALALKDAATRNHDTPVRLFDHWRRIARTTMKTRGANTTMAPDTESTKMTTSTKKIERFEGQYRFLSNFAAANAVYDGIVYDCAEKAFQAAKSLDIEKRAEIADARSPGQAKSIGRRCTLRPDWESVKLAIMRDIVRSKFRDPDLARRLLETGHAELVEGNHWGDRFWGVCQGAGHNHLGRILMEIREEVR